MPHFGLMNADKLGPGKAALQRARLHIRGGRRRLREGKISAGIVTLYDALDHALEWYLMAGARCAEIRLPDAENQRSRTVYRALVDAEILDESFDYDGFDRLTERALHKEMPDFEFEELVEGLERVMTSLGVMPFREGDLPAEDPATF